MSNLAKYTQSLESFARADQPVFAEFFIGYISSSMPPKEWEAALAAAAKYAAGRAGK